MTPTIDRDPFQIMKAIDLTKNASRESYGKVLTDNGLSVGQSAYIIDNLHQIVTLQPEGYHTLATLVEIEAFRRQYKNGEIKFPIEWKLRR